MNKAICLLIALALASSALAVDTEPYFPMQIGYWWAYQDSSEEGYDSTTTIVLDTTEMDGYLTYVFVDTANGESDTMFYQNREDGFYFYLILRDPDTGIDFGTRPLRMFPNDINIGDEWLAAEVDTTVVIEGFPIAVQMTVTTEFEGFEDMETYAGTFTNCIKTVTTNDWKIDAGIMFSDSGIDVQFVTYFAEDVGIVYELEVNIFADLPVPIGDPTTSHMLTGYGSSGIKSWTSRAPGSIYIAAHPTPFNSSCMISASEGAAIEILDLQGRIVGAFDETPALWQPNKEIGSGVYLVRARTQDGATNTRRIVYLK